LLPTLGQAQPPATIKDKISARDLKGEGMKRDMELIRKMVLTMEDAPGGWVGDIAIDGYTPDQIGYHAHLLVDAGLADGEDITNSEGTGPAALLTSLTWKGHEFTDAARDETRWKKAMGIVKEKAGSVTVAVLTQVLTTLMKSALGVP
jgi:hypothetical protein